MELGAFLTERIYDLFTIFHVKPLKYDLELEAKVNYV